MHALVTEKIQLNAKRDFRAEVATHQRTSHFRGRIGQDRQATREQQVDCQRETSTLVRRGHFPGVRQVRHSQVPRLRHGETENLRRWSRHWVGTG